MIKKHILMKSSNLINILPLAVLFLSINRGLIALAGVVPTQLLYYGVTIFGISVSLLGMINKRSHIVGGRNLRLILMINLLSLIYWLTTDFLLGGSLTSIIVFSQMALIPFIIYMFFDVDEKMLVKLVFFLTLIVSASCVLDFMLLNVIDGKALYTQYQSKIHQSGVAISWHLGPVYHGTGITGSPHDTGNLMALLVVFWFGMLVTKRGHRCLIIFVPLFIMALFMTLSTANIVAAIVGIVAIIIYQIRFMQLKKVFVVIVGIFIAFWAMNFLADHFLNFDLSLITAWVLKLQLGDWEGITKIGLSDYSTDILAFFAGHSLSAKISNVSYVTEFGLLQMPFIYGFFSSVIILLLLLYPVRCFFKSSKHTRKMMLPSVAAVGVGVLSLWHYGSVMRSTNIFLFYAIFAIAIQNYRNKNYIHSDRISERFANERDNLNVSKIQLQS